MKYKEENYIGKRQVLCLHCGHVFWSRVKNPLCTSKNCSSTQIIDVKDVHTNSYVFRLEKKVHNYQLGYEELKKEMDKLKHTVDENRILNKKLDKLYNEYYDLVDRYNDLIKILNDNGIKPKG